MSKVIFKFNRTGLQTSIQDMGRAGYQHYGVPVGGAMDRSSAKIANWLVGNDPGSPVLEMTLTGPEIEIMGDCQIALTGADISASINAIELPTYETIAVKSGSILSFGKLQSGCRAYMAIGGVWQVKRWLSSSSFSTHQALNSDLVSLIHKNSTLIVNKHPFIPKREHPEALTPKFSNSIAVTVLPGPEFNMFSDAAIGYFFKKKHYITKDSNRMGYRLNTIIPDLKPEKEVISSGVLPGTIQVTGSGQAVVLMADAQTTGGYLRLGNVITPDIDRLAQLKPGDEVRFLLSGSFQ